MIQTVFDKLYVVVLYNVLEAVLIAVSSKRANTMMSQFFVDVRYCHKSLYNFVVVYIFL